MAIAPAQEADHHPDAIVGAAVALPDPAVAQPSSVVPAPADPLRLGAKLVLDISIALVLLVVMAPLLLLVVVAIQIESPGSPIYRARRVGYRGRPLNVLKFRKMAHDAKGLPLTLAGDPRLTRVGAFMTRTRIDELPQLWNVVRGQMSLVGPRPEDPRFVALHTDDYDAILSVRPGITGWSQLAFAAETRILDELDPVAHYVDVLLPAKVRLDRMYAQRPRLRSDMATIGWTVLAIICRVEVAVDRKSGRMRRRRRGPGPVAPTVAAAESLSTAS